MQFIEPLESRQLLSASIHPAVRTKPTIPIIINTFIGTYTQTKPSAKAAREFQAIFTSESAKGALAGTVQTSETDIKNVVGTIKVNGDFTLAIDNSAGQAIATYKGKYTVNNFEITGKYKTPKAKGVKPTKGTFVLQD